jgi:hypothetical protein
VKPGAVVVAAAPSIGPAVVTIAGIDVPVLALGLSIATLVLARWIAPPPLRKLSRDQQYALTAILMILLFVIVTGHAPLLGDGKPLGVGMAVVWGIGLGFSGLMVVELASKRAMALLRVMFGMKEEEERP